MSILPYSCIVKRIETEKLCNKKWKNQPLRNQAIA
jgi:hypothetical protein